MSKNIDIKIMLLVGSNGKYSAVTEGEMGWGDLADNIMEWPEHGEAKDPDATSRYIVTVRVPLPRIEAIEPVVLEIQP